jgi:hypothetical protein
MRFQLCDAQSLIAQYDLFHDFSSMRRSAIQRRYTLSSFCIFFYISLFHRGSRGGCEYIITGKILPCVSYLLESAMTESGSRQFSSKGITCPNVTLM